MRVLVTGAAGLIGSAVSAFLRSEHEVVGLDRRPGAQVSRVADLQEALDLDGFDAIVHVAALHAPDVGRAPDSDFVRTNVEATGVLLERAAEAGVGRLVFTSSTSVYGHALEPEGKAAWIDEAVKPQPRDIYDSTKLAAEELVRAASGPRLKTAILRMSRCFPEPVLEMALHRLHRGIDRRDVARAHAMALDSATEAGGTFVISAPPPFERADREELLSDAAAVIRRRAPDLADRFADLGWPLPSSIGRVYSPALAAARLGFTAGFGALAVLDGDCDPAALPEAAHRRSI
ncbi:NAD-dependent epimerase/dehydratase family protein [Allosphingosinicella sp.]|jgi:nucleoside-diphosphate-sugar epimerase|uniref:NAD-dependent epimerase/dehydratase family protein n=1 Tax=Allosphingosinicella sp. TaxID=2823234 RepID=UPI002EFD0436